jgi:hypothetical protein
MFVRRPTGSWPISRLLLRERVTLEMLDAGAEVLLTMKTALTISMRQSRKYSKL